MKVILVIGREVNKNNRLLNPMGIFIYMKLYQVVAYFFFFWKIAISIILVLSEVLTDR